MTHANGILLARRRREVNWALRHLGRAESSGAYDAQGQTSTLSAPRPLAVA
jgi:flagellar biosynthesis/type III secretory pathway chaperone